MHVESLTGVSKQARPAPARPAGWRARVVTWWRARRAAREALDDVPEFPGELSPREQREENIRRAISSILGGGGF